MQTPETLDAPTRVRMAMMSLDLNQTELAEQMSVTRAAVSAWLNRNADRRTTIGPSALSKMSEILNVTQDWISGATIEGGPAVDSSLENLIRSEAEQLPTTEQLLKLVKDMVSREAPELTIGFEKSALGYLDFNYKNTEFEYDFLGADLALNIDVSKKTSRSLDSLTALVWPLLMAKKIDEINGTAKRRYQLILISPPVSNQAVYGWFVHQSRMLGIEVSSRDNADEREIANFIIDPNFQDGALRWPQDLLDYQKGFFER